MRGQTKVLFSFCFGVFAFRCIPIEPKYTQLIYTLPFFLVPLCESLALYKIANQFVSQRQLVVWLVFALNTFNHTNDYDCIFVIKLVFQGVKGQQTRWRVNDRLEKFRQMEFRIFSFSVPKATQEKYTKNILGIIITCNLLSRKSQYWSLPIMYFYIKLNNK